MKLHDRTPDLYEAAQFITTLANTSDAPVHWALIPDRETPGLYPRTLFGRLSDLGLELTWANQKGCGIFVAVQGMELVVKDRKILRTSECAREARAVFIDWDQPDFNLRHALPPSMTVLSGRGYHSYWCLTEDEPVSAVPETLRRLATYYESDPSCTDLARVMRVPGFWHCKADPIQTVLTFADPNIRYTLAAIDAAHPVVTPVPIERIQPRSHGGTNDWFAAWADEQDASSGQRNRTCYAIAATGFRHGLSHGEVEAAVRDYQRRATRPDDPFTLTEARNALASASRRNSRS